MFRNWILVAIWFGACLGVAFWAGKTYGQTTNSWINSPLNWNNSPLNYENSPLRWENSPLNWANSELNSESRNSVYDNDGNRQGYVVESPTGVNNYFSGDATSRYFQPRKEKK